MISPVKYFLLQNQPSRRLDPQIATIFNHSFPRTAFHEHLAQYHQICRFQISLLYNRCKKLLQHSVKNTIVAYPISFVLYHSIATNLYSYKDFPKCFSFHYNQTEYYESEPHIVNLKTCRQGGGMN